jgi:flagellar biosynthesis protein FlhG
MTAEALFSVTSAQERKLISIASGKGGVGKTFMSISLAHALARLGKNILLFDADFGLANVDIQLGLTPKCDLADVISGAQDMCDIIHRYEDATIQNAGFDIIAGNSGSGILANLKPSVLASLRNSLAQLATHYDYVLMDLGAGIDDAGAILSDHCGHSIVVMTPDPAALTDAYALMKTRRAFRPARNFSIIVNCVANKSEAQVTFEGISRVCSSFLKFTPYFLGFVHQDKWVSEAVREQTPLLTRQSNSKAAQDVMRVANDICAHFIV